jgi:CheY-like chemotaxis protein
MLIFIVAVIVFVIADILIRMISKRLQEKKTQAEREAVLAESLRLDFSREAKSLKRATVENPKARILCVDDEEVILSSFRKILVLDGYSVDTVESGQEALGLVQSHHYDFVFTDLKMPRMDGVEVTKGVKHLRPDIDVIIITGYATVETAVETMRVGAMDYVQKPFTEDELLAFVKKSLIKRQDRIQKQLKPRVHITHMSAVENVGPSEFAIPGGVFISTGHCWVAISEEGPARVGMDDFSRKLIGKPDAIDLPNLGMTIERGQSLFNVRQGTRSIPFHAPISGKIIDVNAPLAQNPAALEASAYGENWICIIDPEKLDSELPDLKIGNTAVSYYQEEIERFRKVSQTMHRRGQPGEPEQTGPEMYQGELQDLEENDYQTVVSGFFRR